jgi:hypothetical protein
MNRSEIATKADSSNAAGFINIYNVIINKTQPKNR